MIAESKDGHEQSWRDSIEALAALGGLLCLFWIFVRVVLIFLSEAFEFVLPRFLAAIFSVPWYYVLAVAGILSVTSYVMYRTSPERIRKAKIEWQAEQEKLNSWNKWSRAFESGNVSEYPPAMDAREYGGLMVPGEVCYFAAQAVYGRGSVHQLEISIQGNRGVEFKGLKLGQAKGTKNTYSSVQYDEEHPGNLLVTNKRVSFASKPAILLDIAPSQILSVAFQDDYVMVRTNLTSDDTKNLISFRIKGELPAWLFASAIFRLPLGNTAFAPELRDDTSPKA